MFAVFALIVFTASLIYLLAQKRYKFWNDRGFISAPTVFPYGNIKGFGTKVPVCEGLDKIYKAFKGKAEAVGIFFFISPSLMILDLELLKNIYIRDFASFHDRGFYYNKKDDPLSANMVRKLLSNIHFHHKNSESQLTLEGQEWRDRRSKLSPIFTSGKMKMMFDIVDDIGDKFVKAIDKELSITRVVEMRQMLAKYSTDVISSVAFGLDSNCKRVELQVDHLFLISPIM